MRCWQPENCVRTEECHEKGTENHQYEYPLNLLEESDRKAWEHLQNMDRKEYKSYSRAVVATLNDYFDRKEKLEEDPYLETREKEDVFLDSLLSKFEKRLENAVPLMIAEHMFQLLQHMPRGVDSENTGKWDYEKRKR